MLNVNIICVGKLKESYLRAAIEEYSKRMRTLCKLSVIELAEERTADNPSAAEIQKTVSAESERILQKLGKSDYVVAMCVEGKNLSSEELSAKLGEIAQISGSVDFIIGRRAQSPRGLQTQHGKDDLSPPAVPRDAPGTDLPRVPDI